MPDTPAATRATPLLKAALRCSLVLAAALPPARVAHLRAGSLRQALGGLAGSGSGDQHAAAQLAAFRWQAVAAARSELNAAR